MKALLWRRTATVAMLAAAAACAASGPPPATTPVSSAVSVGSAAPPRPGGDVVLAIDDARHFRIQELATGELVHVLPNEVVPAAPPLIAAAPHGWLVTFKAAPAPIGEDTSTRLALLDTSGNLTPFGPTFTPDRPVTGMAVSPDGAQVALALMETTASGPPAALMLLAMPGHRTATRRWTLDDRYINELMSLSWAPDGRRISYIAGSQTGAGIGGNPVTFDTTGGATAAPTKPSWPPTDGQLDGQCEPDGATWIPASGAFAIVRDCPPNGTYTVVDAATGAPTGTPLALPHYACLAAEMHPAFDGSKMLISRCDRVELLDAEGVRELDSHLTDAAFPGA